MSEPQDTWRADTISILADGGVTVTVSSASYITTSSALLPHVISGSTTVETATVMIFQLPGHQLLGKGEAGLQADADYQLFFPFTSTVAVNHRIRESGEVDYFEVESIEPYEDHKEVKCRKVGGRT